MVGIDGAATLVLYYRYQMRIACTAEFTPCFYPKRKVGNPLLGDNAFKVAFEFLFIVFPSNSDGASRTSAVGISAGYRVGVRFRLIGGICYISFNPDAPYCSKESAMASLYKSLASPPMFQPRKAPSARRKVISAAFIHMKELLLLIIGLL